MMVLKTSSSSKDKITIRLTNEDIMTQPFKKFTDGKRVQYSIISQQTP